MTQATSLYSTFSNCSLIKSLDITCLNTSNINSMSYAFRNCSSLTSIDLSNFDFRKVEGIKGFFSYIYGGSTGGSRSKPKTAGW